MFYHEAADCQAVPMKIAETGNFQHDLYIFTLKQVLIIEVMNTT